MASHVSWCPEHVNPVAILLTSSGSSGDRLVFRYPMPGRKKNVAVCGPNAVDPSGDQRQAPGNTLMVPQANDGNSDQDSVDSCHSTSPINNPYSMSHLMEDLSRPSQHEPASAGPADSEMPVLHNGDLSGLREDILASLLSVKKGLCEQKLELKIDDAVFVGFPCNLAKVQKRDQTISTFSVVFVMHAVAPSDVLHNYFDLAKQVAMAIYREENRCGYLARERNIIQRILDDLPERPAHGASPFSLALSQSQLCRELQQVFDNMCATGQVSLMMNGWIPVSHCLPHKAYHVNEEVHVAPDSIKQAVDKIRPYHGLLLTASRAEVTASLTVDSIPTMARLIRFCDPTRHLQSLAIDIDVTCNHVRQLATNLIFWGKAIIIYPLCESNVYVLAPDIDLILNETLLLDFAHNFTGTSLPEILSAFSTPISLRDHPNLPHGKEQTYLLTWLLKKHLLVQLHTYVTLVCDDAVADSSGGGHHVDADVMAVLRRHCTDEQIDCILSLPIARSKENLAFFARLLPYFDGQFHIEQIMFQESKTRIEVTRCIDMFGQVLITVLLPDPVTSCFAGVS